MANGGQGADGKVWNIANVIISILAGLIAIIIGFGLNALANKIEQGDAAIYSRLGEVRSEIKGINDCLMRMQSDITRIDTLQKMRIEKENREENRKRDMSK